ncbi:minor capsid protein [Empedobacter sp.]|uniref:minor capsid protein n=1 Tax=Empedobacter sp. TaxID=1927715 RepID=UPI00289770A6|nr:minor capsid protein [Empedobacter sp.]
MVEIDFNTPDYYFHEILRKNTWNFSSAKNNTDNQQLNNLLINEDGGLKVWHTFKYDAIYINKLIDFDDEFIQKDYELIISTAQMCRLWIEIQRDKAVFPFVQFLVVQDDHTSDICSPLHGLIFSVDDPVLAYYFPPNHLGCRTTLKRLRYGVLSKNVSLPEIQKEYQFNVYKIVNKYFGEYLPFLVKHKI